MPRRNSAVKRDVLPDPMYNSKLVTKLINQVMLDGKKGLAQSIVYGAFAFMIMVMVGMRASLLGGIIVSTLLIIPMFIRSGDEISKSVPDDMIDAAFSLGATKWETLKVVVKQVLPGMATATLLAVGKAIGDAAAVMFTAGFSDSVATSLSSPTATLPLAIFNWITMPEPFPGRAYAAALVLTVIVLILSLGGRWITNHFTKNI